MGRPQFVGDDEVFEPEDYERVPMLRDLFVPQGVKWGAGTIIETPVVAKIVFGLRRRTEVGPFDRQALDRLDALRSHLARGAVISGRLRLERARAASQTLAALGLPAIVFDDAGAVLAVNDLIERNAHRLRWRARDRVALRDAVAEQKLREALATAHEDTGAAVRSFPVRDPDGRAALVAHVVPIRRSARDVFPSAAAAFVLAPIAAPQAPPVSLIQSLFDLTPAQAEVASGLASGKTVDDLAAEAGVSSNTVRSHVRCVLEKTGARRQTDVVALMGGLALPRSA